MLSDINSQTILQNLNYLSEKQINIVNYNKPLPPVRISDLNERSFFNERDTENPEIIDMFKALGIIESFGTGIGEAKRSMRENGSPELYYKLFDVNDNVTSVVIPVNEDYYEIKHGAKPKKNVWIESETKDIKQKILDSKYSKKIKQNTLKIYEEVGTEVFGNSRVVEILGCSEVTATAYLKRMEKELKITIAVRVYMVSTIIIRLILSRSISNISNQRIHAGLPMITLF